jgi:hypothetical protein
MSGSSSAVKQDGAKPRQRLNKVAPAEQNKIMEDIIKRAAQKKKVCLSSLQVVKDQHTNPPLPVREGRKWLSFSASNGYSNIRCCLPVLCTLHLLGYAAGRIAHGETQGG